MSDINRLVLVGNLVKEPQIKNFETTSVLNFTIASNKTIFKNGQKSEMATFVDCKYFTKGAEKLMQFLTKGKKVAVEGSLEQESWTDNEGKKHSRLVISVGNLQMLSYDKNGGSAPQTTTDDFPEDCPF